MTTDDLTAFADWDALPGQLPRVIERARGAAPTEALAASFAAIEATPADARFRGFVGATFAADLACYAAPADQVIFARLVDAMQVYPRGFRLWGAMIEGDGGAWTPLGYTGVIPIAAATFARFEAGAASLAGPPTSALPEVEPGGSFLYLFNYSVVPGLRGTPLAARVIKALAEDVRKTPHLGLAALTVSGDGERVARRFGMEARGRVGGHETIFMRRGGSGS